MAEWSLYEDDCLEVMRTLPSFGIAKAMARGI